MAAATPAAAARTLLTVLPDDPHNPNVKRNFRMLIGTAVFGSSFDLQRGPVDFRQYLEYYEGQIRGIQLEEGAIELRPAWEVKVRVLRFHEDVLEVMRLLQQHKENDKKTIRHRLSQMKNETDERALNWAIDTTLRLTFAINTRHSSLAYVGLKRQALQWPDEQKLQSFLSACFPSPKWPLEVRESRPDPHFTVPFMVSVCSLRLRWTDSLEDHLRLDRGTNELWLFPHKQFIQGLLKNTEFAGYDTWFVSLPFPRV
jgi:hypothetical protein